MPFVYGALTLFGRPFQCRSPWLAIAHSVPESWQVLQPRLGEPNRFGLFPVRSPLLGEYSLFLGVLRCFSSPGSLSQTYVFSLE